MNLRKDHYCIVEKFSFTGLFLSFIHTHNRELKERGLTGEPLAVGGVGKPNLTIRERRYEEN